METNRRSYKGISESSRDLLSLSPLLILRFIFCLIMFSSLSSVAQNDSTKNKIQFDINDPRNPDCPCHKLQKQAEDEFALLNKRKNGDLNNQQQDFQNDNHNSYANNSNYVSGQSKRKRNIIFIRKRKHHYSNRSKKLWQEHSFSINCFRWQ